MGNGSQNGLGPEKGELEAGECLTNTLYSVRGSNDDDDDLPVLRV